MADKIGQIQEDKMMKLMTGLAVLCLLMLAGAFWREGRPRSLPVLYPAPSFSFRNAVGEPVGLDDLKGKVWVADFIYLHCTSQCPLMTSALEKYQEKWKEKGIKIVSFTLDPKDTPEELTQYAAAAGADPACWFFLEGKNEEVIALAKNGFHLAAAKDPDSDFIHSTRIALVDRAGQIRGYYDGLNGNELEDLNLDLKTLLEEKS